MLLVISYAAAQIGGTTTYNFLSLSPDARITALGGTNVSIFDHDLNTQLANPASLNRKMNGQAAFSTVVYPGGINFGNASYGKRFNKVPGTFGFGIQYMAYGKFTETDEAANVIGKFSAGEMNIYTGYGYQFGRLFSVGANVKFIYSNLAQFNSVGMAADLAATVNDTAHNITASIVARNIGVQFKPYNSTREPIPFDLQAGISVGFKGVPFRIHATFHHLTTWDIRYDNPADQQNDNLFTDTTATKAKKYTGDKLFRHVIIGVEFNIKQIVRLDVAYNHLRQQELKLANRRGVPGLSFGVGVRIRQFDFSYGFQPMAQGQTMNHLTLTIYTDGFVRKKSAPKS